MRNDFRINVIQSTLLALPKLGPEFSKPVDRLTRKFVKVAGFRNSTKAPVFVKGAAMVKAFEKEPTLVAAVLHAWSESKDALRQEIFDLLTKLNWPLLPIEFNRTKLPGFLTQWPDEDDYAKIYDTYVLEHPDSDSSIDETSLMVVWLAGRLPIEKISKNDLMELETPTEEEKP
jgi:hypothetical protein